MVPQAKLRHLPDRYPLACQWEITCRCNLRCAMCYTDCFNQPEFVRHELTTADILRILDELAAAGTLELCLTGGEPLARPDFFAIYEHAIDKGLLVTLFTNGTLITADAAKRLAARPPKQIEISLHGVTPATFEQVTRGQGSWARCREGIDLVRAQGIPLVLKTVAMTLNQDDVLAVKRAAEELPGVRFKLGEDVRPLLNGDERPLQYRLPLEDRTALFRQDPDLWEEHCAQALSTPGLCRSGLQKFHIDAYGMLQLCSGNRQQGYDLRRGTFQDGFYGHLPSFGCPRKSPAPDLIQPLVHHA